MRLDFVVAGFSKCGTTSLCSMLGKHNNLFFPSRFKEPRFFNKENYELYWNLYSNLFYSAPSHTLLGEGSITYSEAEFALISAKRIRKHFPRIKIIFIARDPVTRLESSYREMHNSGNEWGLECPYNMEDTLRALPNLLNDTKYWNVLDIYEAYFSRDQILVLFQEELKQNTQKVISQCCQFLGVSNLSLDLPNAEKQNQGETKYFDSPAFRSAKQSKEFARALSKINVNVQNQFLPGLNMRQAFGKKEIFWSTDAKNQVVNALAQYPFDFLSKYGKEHSLWNKYLQFTN